MGGEGACNVGAGGVYLGAALGHQKPEPQMKANWRGGGSRVQEIGFGVAVD